MTIVEDLRAIRDEMAKAKPEIAAALENKIIELDHILSSLATRIDQLEHVATSLLNHRNTWFSDQQQAMAAAGFPT